jgi:hypothetical protein
MEPGASFVFSRESRIRIDREGRFWHEGERVAHPRLEQALASWVDLDGETGRYILRNALDWCFVTVEETPLAVRAVRVTPSGFEVERSDGGSEPLALDTVRVTDDGRVYARVREKRLPARFDRGAAFALLEHAEEQGGAVFLRAGGELFPVARGEP